jgi:predicted DNA-binding protein YlxM (UPF0122 family)
VLASSLTQRENIAQLYRTGLSAREIAEKTNTGIDAVYYTLRLLKVARRSHSENSKTRFARKPLSYHIKTSLSQSEELLKTASIMLYWAEGYKVGDMTTIDFANSDPAMALIFTKFLREICRVDVSVPSSTVMTDKMLDYLRSSGVSISLFQLPSSQNRM